MRTALTVWEDRISPVFDAAVTLLVADIENETVTNQRYETFDPMLSHGMGDRLTRLEIRVLVCGAISEYPAGIIESLGIRLIPFIAGNTKEILGALTKGRPIVPRFLMPGCSPKGTQIPEQ